MEPEVIVENELSEISQENSEIKPDVEAVKKILHLEMQGFMDCMNDPDKASEMLKDEKRFARFKQLFGTKFRAKKCT
jgi:hypothetical protein